MATELILIRHGHAVRVNGHYVPAPLTELGQKQADLTGKYLCRTYEQFDGFYCSPLRRAKETAARIGVQTAQIPHITNGIQELEGLEVPQLVLFETLAPIVVPVYEGKTGSPVLFARELFDELRQLQGESGGKQILQARHDEAERVNILNTRAAFDVDTPQDYQAALAEAQTKPAGEIFSTIQTEK